MRKILRFDGGTLRFLFGALLAALPPLFCGGCDRGSSPRFEEEEAELRSVAALKALCDGQSSVVVRQDIAIRVRITGNDRYGERVGFLNLEDETAGITLAVEGRNLALEYPFGACVTLLCNGLTLYEYGGKILLGTTPDEYGVGRIPREEVARYLHFEENPSAAPEPRVRRFDEISFADVDRYVRFDDVCFPDGGTWCRRDPETTRYRTTEHRILDGAGREFTVRIASTAAYAGEPLPEGRGSLCGVIDYFAGRFSLVPVNYGDHFSIAATPPKVYP